MPSYPAKPFVVPHDDWFNNNSSNFKNKSNWKGAKSITTIHEFFYKQSHVKVGGSDNLIKTNLGKKSSQKIIISSHPISDKSVSSKNKEKYCYSNIPSDLKSIKKRSFQAKTIYKDLSNKNIFKFKTYLLDLKSVFIKIISSKRNKIKNKP
tara:strand:+ start:568 stop:1020 length:453 start_codon:yes stop_codon:yes gene_type:complete